MNVSEMIVWGIVVVILYRYWKDLLHFALTWLVMWFGGAFQGTKVRSAADNVSEEVKRECEQQVATDDERRENHEKNAVTRALRWFEGKCLEWDMPDLKYGPNQQAIPVMEVDVSAIQNREAFYQLTVDKTRPLVIRGWMRDSVAAKLWTPDWFAEHSQYGKYKIFASLGNNNCKKDPLNPHSMGMAEVSVKEVVEIGKRAQSSQVYYGTNLQNIFNDFPQLEEDLQLQRLKDLNREEDGHVYVANLFLGGKGTGTPVHCAPGANFFHNVYGRKRWTLIDPKYTKYLRHVPNYFFMYARASFNPMDLLSPKDGVQSHFTKIPRMEFTLAPGDLLYLPPWWWHHVYNESNMTIGAAVRDMDVYEPARRINFLWTIASPLLQSPLLCGAAKMFGLHPRKFMIRAGKKGEFEKKILHKVL